MRHLGFVLLLALGFLVHPACAADPPSTEASAAADIEPIRVGIAIPISGPLASVGEQAHNGFREAADAINATGGVLGRPLSLIYEDDGCDAKQAVTAADRLVAQGVSMATHLCSPACMAARDIYRDNNVLMIAAACSNDALTAEGYPLVDRAYPSAADEANAVADYILTQSQQPEVAYVVDREGFVTSFANHIRDRLAARQIEPLDWAGFDTGNRDFTAVITKLKKENPNIVVLGAWPNELGLFVRQARAAGLTSTIITADIGISDVVPQIAGSAVDGLMFVYVPNFLDNPNSRAIIGELKAKGIDSSGFTLFPFALIQIYAAAVKEAGTADPEKVGDVLRHNKFKTVIGDIGFDDKGNLIGVTPVMYRYEGNSYQPVNSEADANPPPAAAPPAAASPPP